METERNYELEDRFAVAVIGMAGRFPGAGDVEEFWSKIRDQEECIHFFTDEELLELGINPEPLRRDPDYVPAGGLLADMDAFDAAFFNVHPREAELLDPQHRLFLETTVQALQNAGQDPATYDGLIGVYAGSDLSSYGLRNLWMNPSIQPELVNDGMLGNLQDTLATRVAFKLDLRGPAYAIQTNCSTSLVAVHVATQAVLNEECDVALAGGVFTGEMSGYSYTPGGITSVDGHCRPFDAKAQGAPYGCAVACVVLKRLEDAVADGDNVLAVILGSAINNDGALKAGFTAPSVQGQADVVTDALAAASVGPETIDFVQAHGSGTEVGDPIEVEALTRAFRTGTERRGYCALGSVKAIMGHADRAAGVTNLIAAVQAIRHRQIPPLFNFERPNPAIDFENSPFYVPTEVTEWPRGERPRRAGVTALGLGGTNAHVVIEEAPELPSSGPSRPWQLVLLSAKTRSALDTAVAELAGHFEAEPEENLADAAFTLQRGRTAFDYRAALVCRSVDDARETLSARDPKRLLFGLAETGRPVTFTFPGVGDHYPGMGLGLYREEKVFRQAVDRCAEHLEKILDLDVRGVLYPEGIEPVKEAEASAPGPDFRRMVGRAGNVDEADERLSRTEILHPVLFVVEYAMARQWMAWGIRPESMTGYSIGEIVAACLAGVLSLEDALELVARRARWIETLEGGAMIAVSLSEEEVEGHLSEDLSLSAANGPSLSVLGGPTAAVDELEQKLEADGVAFRRLPTTHAFHSRMMEPVREEFERWVGTLELSPPEIPVVSTVTGTWATAEEITDPAYWGRHLCQAVRFAEAVETLYLEPGRILLEVGPGQALGSLAMQYQGSAEQNQERIVLASIRNRYDRRADQAFLLETLGKLWLSGVAVDWDGFYAGERRLKRPLPTYPFERKKYWIEPAVDLPPSLDNDRKIDVADWSYVPYWSQSPRPLTKPDAEHFRWLIFLDEVGIGEALSNRLREAGHEVIQVAPGESFAQVHDEKYVMPVAAPEAYRALVRELRQRDLVPERIVHAWNLSPVDGDSSRRGALGEAQDRGFYSLLFLVKALDGLETTETLPIYGLSNNVFEVGSGDARCPEKATYVGIGKAIPKEFRHLDCQLVDLDAEDFEGAARERLESNLLNEIFVAPKNDPVAYRMGRRWERGFQEVRLDETSRVAERLRRGGVYLLTGGLGGLGLGLAEHLARKYRAKLVLTGRTGLPPREEWNEYLETHDEDDKTSYKIRRVREIESHGSEVMIGTADVADLEAMRRVVDEARSRFGAVHGVVHLAGVPGAGIITLKTREMADKVLVSKLEGTLVLDELFAEEPLDFLILYSSMTAVTTGFGEVDYSAANNFLDAFAHYSARYRDRFTLSINWPAWLWDDWQDELLASMPDLQAIIQRGRTLSGLTFEEGADALERALASTFPQVVVSTSNFHNSLWAFKSWSMHGVMEDLDEDHQLHERPATLRNAFVAPSSVHEKTIVKIWRDFLGIAEIGVHDNFFDLGGQSLMGTQIINRLRQALDVDLAVSVLYEAPTVAEMAAHIECALADREAVAVT